MSEAAVLFGFVIDEVPRAQFDAINEALADGENRLAA